MPCHDSSIDYQTGNLSVQGNSIISNYDAAEAKFKENGLYFSNNLINSSTGELNTQGQSIYKHLLKTQQALKEANIPYDVKYINPRTGNFNTFGEKAIEKKVSFHGADRTNVMHEDADTIVNEDDFFTPEGYKYIGTEQLDADVDNIYIQEPDIIQELTTPISDNLTDGTEIAADTISDLPILESVYGLSLLIKAKDPLIDLKDGKYRSAGIRTAIRASETALLLPIKHSKALIEGLKGIYLSVKGVESDHTGFIKGYKHSLAKWSKSRHILEELAINPELIPYYIPSLFQDKHEIRQRIKEDAIATWQYNIKEQSYKQHQEFENREQNNLKHHESASNNFANIIDEENKQKIFYNSKLNNISSNIEIDINILQQELCAMQTEQNNLDLMYSQYINQLQASLANLEDEDLITEKVNEISKGIREYYEERQEKIAKEINRINNIILTNKKITAQERKTGFNRIAGYNHIKSKILDIFINPVKQKNANISTELPNMILLYGPKGCGKSLLANAIEKESGCNIIKLEPMLNSKIDLENLKESITKAKSHYDKNGTHTIIRIEELNSFMPEISNESLKELNTLADKNHCTIIATTNFPNEINKQLLPKQGLKEIYIGPAKLNDIQEILKYYIADFADTSINYKELAQQVLDIAYEDAYSNAKIECCMQNGIKNKFSEKEKLSQQDFIEILNESYPDIMKNVLDSYRKEGI